MFDDLITQLKPLSEKLFFSWREIWYEVRTVRKSRKVKVELFGTALWNEEQRVAKLTIYEIDHDGTASIFYETVALHDNYTYAILWSMEQISEKCREYEEALRY